MVMHGVAKGIDVMPQAGLRMLSLLIVRRHRSTSSSAAKCWTILRLDLVQVSQQDLRGGLILIRELPVGRAEPRAPSELLARVPK